MRGEEYKIRKGEGGRRGIYEGGEEEYNIRKGEGEGDVYMRGGEEYI